MSQMAPHECTETACTCAQYRWNLRSCVLRSDPPSTCMCGHLAMHHRFRLTDKPWQHR